MVKSDEPAPPTDKKTPRPSALTEQYWWRAWLLNAVLGPVLAHGVGYVYLCLRVPPPPPSPYVWDFGGGPLAIFVMMYVLLVNLLLSAALPRRIATTRPQSDECWVSLGLVLGGSAIAISLFLAGCIGPEKIMRGQFSF